MRNYKNWFLFVFYVVALIRNRVDDQWSELFFYFLYFWLNPKVPKDQGFKAKPKTEGESLNSKNSPWWSVLRAWVW
jgi:hypothetical protein